MMETDAHTPAADWIAVAMRMQMKQSDALLALADMHPTIGMGMRPPCLEGCRVIVRCLRAHMNSHGPGLVDCCDTHMHSTSCPLGGDLAPGRGRWSMPVAAQGLREMPDQIRIQ